MKIGVPKEIKNKENRVGLVPSSVAQLVADCHELFIETNGINVSGGVLVYEQVAKDLELPYTPLQKVS